MRVENGSVLRGRCYVGSRVATPPSKEMFCISQGSRDGVNREGSECAGRRRLQAPEVQQEEIPCMQTRGANRKQRRKQEVRTPGKGGNGKYLQRRSNKNAGAKAVGQT